MGAPRLGEHSAQVLTDLGLDAAEIAATVGNHAGAWAAPAADQSSRVKRTKPASFEADEISAADGAGAARGSMHAAGIELDDSVFVGKTAESDGIVVGIVFGSLNDFERGVERVAATGQHAEPANQLEWIINGCAGVPKHPERRVGIRGCKGTVRTDDAGNIPSGIQVIVRYAIVRGFCCRQA